VKVRTEKREKFEKARQETAKEIVRESSMFQ